MPLSVLIVAPHFAPTNAPDGHRARLILPWLADHGWEPTVLTVRPDRATAPLEPGLLSTYPSEIPVHRVDALDPAAARRFGMGNLGWRSLPWLCREGTRLLRTGRYHLVYFSTTQSACLPLGRYWRWRFNIPYVIDLQDPWHNIYYDQPGAPRPPGGWKYRIASVTTRALEGWTLRRCSHVVTVSARYIDDIRQRRPWFDPGRATVIPFGWSERDQVAARTRSVSVTPAPASILYVGRVGEDMARLLRLLLSAFGEWRLSRPAAAPVHWSFVGSSYASQPGSGGTVARLARELGMENAVSEEPARIGYLDAIARQQQSTANLMLGSDDLSYSPSKLWPTLAAGRPWLAFVPGQSVVAELLRPHAASGFLLVAATDGIDLETRKRLFEFLDGVSARCLEAPPPSPALRNCHANLLARHHADIFNQVVSP